MLKVCNFRLKYIRIKELELETNHFFFQNNEKVKQTINIFFIQRYMVINIFFIQTLEIYSGEVALLYLIKSILIKELFNIKVCKTLFIDNLKLKYFFFLSKLHSVQYNHTINTALNKCNILCDSGRLFIKNINYLSIYRNLFSFFRK